MIDERNSGAGAGHIPNLPEFDAITDPLVDAFRALFAAAIEQALGDAWAAFGLGAGRPVELTYGHPVPLDLVPQSTTPSLAVWRVRDGVRYQGKRRRTSTVINARYVMIPCGYAQTGERWPMLSLVVETLLGILTGNPLICIDDSVEDDGESFDAVEALFGAIGGIEVDRNIPAADYALALPTVSGAVVSGDVFPSVTLTFEVTHDGVTPLAVDASQLEALRTLCVALRCGTPEAPNEGPDIVEACATANEPATGDDC